MQQRTNPELCDNSIVKLQTINYHGHTIHFFGYNNQTWYFVRDLTLAFGIYTFKHATKRTGKYMYVRIEDDGSCARILQNAVHVNTLRAMGQDIRHVSDTYRKRVSKGVQKVCGRREYVALSEHGVMTAIKNSPYCDQVFHALGLAASASECQIQQATLGMPQSFGSVIGMNVRTESGSLSVQVTAEYFDNDSRARIMSAIQDIIDELQ